MFRRVHKLQAGLPAPKRADSNGAALQELLGGDCSEMSTPRNSMDQSFDCCSTFKPRPLYNLVASVTANEPGHVAWMANVIAVLAHGPDKPANGEGGADLFDAPFADMSNTRLAASFPANGGGTMPMTDRRLLEVVAGLPERGNIRLTGMASALDTDVAPEMSDITTKRCRRRADLRRRQFHPRRTGPVESPHILIADGVVP